MAGKRKRTPSGYSKKTRAPKKKWVNTKKRRINVKAMINKAINVNVETKKSCYTSEDGTEIFHNNFIMIDSNLLSTSQGLTNPETSQSGNRIGDKLTCKGVSLKFMFELNERYSDVTFRLMVVRSARGDVPTRATLFNGLCGNKSMDTMNTDRYSLIAGKTFKMKSPNMTAVGDNGTSVQHQSVLLQNAGTYYAGGSASYAGSSRATRMVNLWIPGSKFARNGVILYDANDSQKQKFWDYHVLCFAYSNYSCLQDVWAVGRVNDYMRRMFYKDG